jgi:hypothetical protein
MEQVLGSRRITRVTTSLSFKVVAVDLCQLLQEFLRHSAPSCQLRHNHELDAVLDGNALDLPWCGIVTQSSVAKYLPRYVKTLFESSSPLNFYYPVSLPNPMVDATLEDIATASLFHKSVVNLHV